MADRDRRLTRRFGLRLESPGTYMWYRSRLGSILELTSIKTARSPKRLEPRADAWMVRRGSTFHAASDSQPPGTRLLFEGRLRGEVDVVHLAQSKDGSYNSWTHSSWFVFDGWLTLRHTSNNWLWYINRLSSLCQWSGLLWRA
jgi:hypothetical protein